MMKMLKKHYEKFIFIFLLLIFLLLLGVQALSSDEQQQVTIPPVKNDYAKINFDDDKYHAEKHFRNISGDVSLKSVDKKDEKKKGAYSEIDLLAPPKLARCPHFEQEHLIPISDFPADEKEVRKKKCSACNSPFDYVPPEIYELSSAAQSLKDSDNDGIPDDEEKKAGLNPQNPNDVNEDADKDGFSNLEEYRLGTMMNNPKSRPSYATKLFVKEIHETPIGIKVTRFTNDKDEKNPEKWMVQLSSVTVIKRTNSKGKVRENSKLTTPRTRIGREIKKVGTDGHTYIVERIIPKFGDKDGNRVNISTVVLKRVDTGELYTAAPGQDFIDPKKDVVFECQLPAGLIQSPNKEGKGIFVKIGTEFKIGNNETGIDVFTTVSAERNLEAKNSEDRMKAKVMQKVSGGSVYFDVKTLSEYGNNMASDRENDNGNVNGGTQDQGSIGQF